ncbi:aluminum-activated malate transporter 2-like [Argentina anserina]|uniref:aluminum-activated malate transporter 2-like n=1 Tax=Argentina anserina TaxID=57926 RepID=UPI0021766BE3|nr:aluminum-activated malate transporter 2-like [Potentilla anserina]
MTYADTNGVETAGCSGGPFSRVLQWIKAAPAKSWGKVVEIARKAKKLGKDDPRRIVHSGKVGLALTLVCLFYYFRPIDGFGVDAMWAILTVALVFEYTAGGTLERGLNRMVATIIAGPLAVGAHHITTLWGGEIAEPILIGFFVFVVAAIMTFLRFFPLLKARHDYFLVIFILTYSLVSVSGYRDYEILEMAHIRISTVAIGGCTTIIISLCICPVWIGVDLQNLVASNIDKLGDSMEGFGSEYFDMEENGLSSSVSKSLLKQYTSVLTSKGPEDFMANLAWWEPGHGKFKFCHPWEKYLNVGAASRICAYKIEALNTYLNNEIQAPAEIRNKIQEQGTHICIETGKALKELAAALKNMTLSSSADHHITVSKAAAESLMSLLRGGIWKDAKVIETVTSAAVALLLIEVVTCVEKIAEALHELESAANFKTNKGQVLPEPVVTAEESHVAIAIFHDSTGCSSAENKSSDGTTSTNDNV